MIKIGPFWGDVHAQSLPNLLRVGLQVWNFKEEGNFSYDVQLSDGQELLWLSQNLDWQMTPYHENHSGALYSQGYISQAQARLLTRFVIPRRRHHYLSINTNIIENRHRELCQPCTGKSTKVRKFCWKSDTFFHPGDHLRAQSLPDSLRVDPQAKNFKKKDNLRYDEQLSVHR